MLLEQKLELLQGMLRLTEKTQNSPNRLDERLSGAFRKELADLIGGIQRIDSRLVQEGDRVNGAGNAGEETLLSSIRETKNRIMAANADLIASLSAQREIIGAKILSLKERRHLLRSYSPGQLPSDAPRVDARA